MPNNTSASRQRINNNESNRNNSQTQRYHYPENPATHARHSRNLRPCKCRRSRAAIRIAFYSGMRLSEILEAKRIEGMFLLADTKNGEPRHVPIHPKIRSTAKVPPRKKWNVSKEFKAGAISVGMGHLRFHDLRHSAASTQRYAHLATESIKMALGEIGKKSPDKRKTRVA